MAYLHEYAATRRLRVRTGVQVERVDPAGTGWRLTTSAGPLATPHVVIACGPFHTPRLPAWAEAADFPGEVVHAADYRNPGPLAGRRVLVVGTGSTGMEIAHELTGHSQQV